MSEIVWTPIGRALPDDRATKLLTVKELKYEIFDYAVGHYLPENGKWYINEEEVNSEHKVIAWNDLPGVFLD